jgi:hypothetical protein
MHGKRTAPQPGSWLQERFKLAQQDGNSHTYAVEVRKRSLGVTIAEGYLNGEVALQVELRMRTVDGESKPREFCLEAERLFGRDDNVLFDGDDPGRPGERGVDVCTPEEAQAREQGPVLVYVREELDRPEDGALWVPSTVRLARLDEFPDRTSRVDPGEWSGPALRGSIPYVPVEVPLIGVDRKSAGVMRMPFAPSAVIFASAATWLWLSTSLFPAAVSSLTLSSSAVLCATSLILTKNGKVMDEVGAATAFIVPAICLALVTCYALFDLRTKRHGGALVAEAAS